MKILVISANAIGDAFLSMAVIEPLKKKYPDAEFYFVFPEQARLLDTKTEDKFTFVFVKKNYLSLLKAISFLHGIKFDRIYSFFPGVFNSVLSSLLRGKIKAGQKNFVKEIRWDNRDCILSFDERDGIKRKVKLNRDNNFLSRISTVLRITDEVNENIGKYKPFADRNSFEGEERILIHYKASIREKSLTLGLLTAMVKYIRSVTDLTIVLVGVEGDFRSNGFEKLAEYSVDYMIDPDLKTLISIIETSLFIGVDSFPLHLADAYNTNFLALCSRTDPKSVLVNYNKALAFGAGSFDEVKSEDFIEQVHHYFGENNFINPSAAAN